jgi:hypothetical protein
MRDVRHRAERKLARERRLLAERVHYVRRHGHDPTMDRQTAARCEAVSAAEVKLRRIDRRRAFLAGGDPNEVRMASTVRRPGTPVAARRVRVRARRPVCTRRPPGRPRRRQARSNRGPPDDDAEPGGAGHLLDDLTAEGRP